MLGTFNTEQREAVIIGAGFSGLLAAYRLLGRGFKVALYDAAPTAGGLIQTWQTPFGISESAAHSIRTSPAIDQLFAELKLETTEAQAKKKFILRGSKFRGFPLTVLETISLLWRAAFQPAKAHYENLADWAQHHFGRGTVDNIFYPMMHGIYAAAPNELSPYLVFPKLIPPAGKTMLAHMWALRTKKSYKPRMIAPKDGMAALTDMLFQIVQAHPHAQISLGQKITELPKAPNVILATNAHAAAEILKNSFPKSAEALTAVNYTPMIAATVFLDKKMHKASKGIGVLCAAQEPCRALGILFNSATFQGRVHDENVASYTVMLGGTGDPGIMHLSDEATEKIIIGELQSNLKLTAKPLEIILHRWPAAIPVYSPQLEKTHEVLRSDFCAVPGRIIFGNYAGQVSLRGLTGQF